MRRFIAIASAAALSVVLFAPGAGAQVGGTTSIVATPGSAGYGYATPVVTAGAGGDLVFENLDALSGVTGSHNVTSLQQTAGGDPLFSSVTFSGIRTEPITVRGALQPGQAYQFRCTIHPLTMNGALVVRPG